VFPRLKLSRPALFHLQSPAACHCSRTCTIHYWTYMMLYVRPWYRAQLTNHSSIPYPSSRPTAVEMIRCKFLQQQQQQHLSAFASLPPGCADTRQPSSPISNRPPFSSGLCSRTWHHALLFQCITPKTHHSPLMPKGRSHINSHGV
jgi:hypothetical protein